MDLQLQGKRALVSGSSKGIGYAIAKLLAAEGAEVWINGRTQKAVASACARIRDAMPQARVHELAADLSTAEGVAAAVAALPAVDILVNNLGIYERKPFGDIADADWQRFFDVNVMSGVRLARAYLSGMKARDWGRIVFVSSESALHIPGDMVHYGFTKTAQLAVSRGIAENCAGTGVTSNCVLPGPTLSDGLQNAIRHRAGEMTYEQFEAEFFKTARPTSLKRRFAQPEEVANLVAYVCSPLSSVTNGAALRCDGGIVRAAIG